MMCYGISFLKTEEILMDLLKDLKEHYALIKEDLDNPDIKKDFMMAKNFRICKDDEFTAMYRLNPYVYINKFICHDKDKEKFNVFDIYNYYNYETGSFHINLFLKEDYKKNITTVQACSIFNGLMRNQFIMTKCNVARKARNFEEGLKLCECKFGYAAGNFIFDEWVEQNGIIVENIESEILEYMQNKEKIEDVSYNFLMNFVQNIDLIHMEPPIDKDPLEFEEIVNNGEIIDIIKVLPI